MKNEKLIMGMVLGAAIVGGGMYLMNRRKANMMAKTGNGEEATSKAIGRETIALKNPCGAKLGEPCEEEQGGDWVTGTWQSGGYGKPCVCQKSATEAGGEYDIWTKSVATELL